MSLKNIYKLHLINRINLKLLNFLENDLRTVFEIARIVQNEDLIDVTNENNNNNNLPQIVIRSPDTPAASSKLTDSQKSNRKETEIMNI